MTATLEGIRGGIAEIERLRAERGRGNEPLWVGYSGFSMGSDKLLAGMRHNVDGAESSAPPATPDEAIDQLSAFKAAGVTHVGVGVTWTDAASLKAELRRFAREVMPAFR